MTSLVNRFANFSVGKQYRNTVERERVPTFTFHPTEFELLVLCRIQVPVHFPDRKWQEVASQETGSQLWGFLVFFLLERNEIAKVAHFEEGRAASVKSGHRDRPEEDLDP